MKGYALSLVWPVVASETNAFICIFFLAIEAKTVLNKKAIKGLELRHKSRYTQTSLSDSAARSCFEKVRFLRSLKIHKKFGF